MEQNKYFSVTALNTLIKSKIDGDEELHNVYVKGEISNWKSYNSGFFFDLVDEKKSVIPCILWSDNYLYLPFEPKNGDEVIALGSVSVYVGRGRYNFTVKTLEKFGQGAALLALEALKKKLQAEGLFDISHKKPIPEFPKSIGLIVGDKSAAEADLIKNISRRWPLCDILVFPSLVQGKDAPKELLKALRRAETTEIDILIIARGGGSNEDLSAFNDEALTRELYACTIPCISAVGHEIDTTLIDYVSDLRVSTPTGAAEAATPDQQEIRAILLGAEDSLNTAMKNLLSKKRDQLNALSVRPFFKNPSSNYAKAKEEVQQLSKRLEMSLDHLLEMSSNQVRSLSSRLEALNPRNVISRGYSMTTDERGNIVTSIKQIAEGDTLKSVLKDGTITSKVTSKE
ncbi:MAG: exodeoxyribonuclease VII large subunit [Bacilli bacterium]|nr:exodeoxyribonuclease VII large subunit [Bacilli bacterium]